MSEVEFLKNLLERDWEPTVTGRSTDVPQPFFTLEKSNREESLRSQDVGYITSGADTTRTYNGLGATHDRIETAVVIEYRVAARNVSTGYTDPYHRLFGQRTGANGIQAADDWDGIIGETERVIRDAGTRIAEWDKFGIEITVSDLTDIGGNAYHRADVLVPMEDIAKLIDTSV